MNRPTEPVSIEKANQVLAKVRWAFRYGYDTRGATIEHDYLDGHTAIVWDGEESCDEWAEIFANRTRWHVKGVHCEAHYHCALILYPC